MTREPSQIIREPSGIIRESREIHRESTAAVILFQCASEEERLTADLARHLASLLRKGRR